MRLGSTASNTGHMGVYSTWTAQRAADFSGAPSTVTGQWGGGVGGEATWAAVESNGYDTSAGTDYPSNFWSALVHAVERGVTGAASAWDTVQAGITDLATWRQGFRTEPRHGSFPRSGVSVPMDVASNVWTPTKSAGVILDGSWANLPLNEWCRVSGTTLQQVADQVLAQTGKTVGALDLGAGNNIATTFNAWCGVAVDQANGKVYNMAGGGHNDSSLNMVSRLDLESMGSGAGWNVDSPPSDPDAVGFAWSAGYRPGPFTNYTPIPGGETGYGNAVAGGISDAYDVLPDGRPTSRHTYDGTAFNSVTGQVMQTRTSRWDYNPATNTFTRAKFTRGGVQMPVLPNDTTVYHAGTNRFYGRFHRADSGPEAIADFGWVSGAVGSGVINVMTGSGPCYGKQSMTVVGADTAIFINNDNVNANARFGVLNMSTGVFTSSGGITNGLNSAGEMPCAAGMTGTTLILRRVPTGGVANEWRLLDWSTMTETAYTPAGLVPGFVGLVGNKMFDYARRRVIVYLHTPSDGVDSVYVMRYA